MYFSNKPFSDYRVLKKLAILLVILLLLQRSGLREVLAPSFGTLALWTSVILDMFLIFV